VQGQAQEVGVRPRPDLRGHAQVRMEHL
jgi:hypothetical protein